MEILALLWLLSGIAAGAIGSSKGRFGFGWFLLGLVLGVFALVMVIAMPVREKRAPVEPEDRWYWRW